MIEVLYAVEGRGDEPVAEKLIRSAGCQPRLAFQAGGKSKLDPKLPGFDKSAPHLCWFVLRDLDHDDRDRCIPTVLQDLLKGPAAPRLALRLAVRAAEAWLLADRQAVAEYFKVALHHVSDYPDDLADPKLELVNLCRASRSRGVRDAMVPRQGSKRSVGPEYTSTIRAFAEESWDPHRAKLVSPSLRRAVECVQRMVTSGAWS